ncbi:MAG: bacteriohemerythrin [Solirubrobacterales bacterium]
MSVMSIQWCDEFKLGLPAMDSDHEELLELCNEFFAAAHARSGLGELCAILGRLILRTRAHFLAEERLLDRHNYPGLALHKAEHARLLTQADGLKDRFDTAESTEAVGDLTLETADFLRTWLLDHIRINDRPYRPFLMSLA